MVVVTRGDGLARGAGGISRSPVLTIIGAIRAIRIAGVVSRTGVILGAGVVTGVGVSHTLIALLWCVVGAGLSCGRGAATVIVVVGALIGVGGLVRISGRL